MDKEKTKARQARYKAAHPDRVKASNKKYSLENRESIAAYGKKYAANHPEKIQAKAARYYARHKDELQEVFRERASAYYAKYPERRAAYCARNKERIRDAAAARYWAHPEWGRARNITKRAIQAGELTPLPCWVCDEVRVDAHHPNYDAPLDVVWLCRRHHKQLHAEVQSC